MSDPAIASRSHPDAGGGGETDAMFFARRAREEAAKAATIGDVRVRSAHVELSHRYAEASRRAAAGIVPQVPGSLLDP